MLDVLQQFLPAALIDNLSTLVMVVLAVAFVLSAIVQQLKTNDKLPEKWRLQPGQAGQLNIILSTIITIGTFVATNLFGNLQADVGALHDMTLAFAAALFASPILAFLVWVQYQVGKLAGWFKSLSSSEGLKIFNQQQTKPVGTSAA